MKLDLRKLVNCPGESKTFSDELTLDDVLRWGKKLFASPVKISGRAENRSEILSVSYKADFTLDVVCDRCLKPLTHPREMKFSHIVVPSLNREDNGEFIVVPDAMLDLAELVVSDILLGIPTSIVCDEGCKGLCPKCGKNLNEGPCGCDLTIKDPRLDVLRDLLQQ